MLKSKNMGKRSKIYKFVFVISSIFLIIALLSILSWQGYGLFNKINTKISGLQSKISYLENEVSVLRKTNMELKQKVDKKPKEIIKREIIIEKSQDKKLTDAVAKITPSVVSIVATKNVPQLEVEYVNPFGDDPFFKDFGVKVPRYKQKGTTEKQVGSGTGFIISKDGKIITNKHVVSDTDAEYTVLTSDGEQKKARVTHRDKNNDIAILKIDGANFNYVNLGNSDRVILGQSVFAVGNALGKYSNSVSVGVISGLNRSITATGPTGLEKIAGVIQTDAAINPGNSGGPLVDLDGNVIGVNAAKAHGSDNIGFSIPINKVKTILN